MAHNFHYLLLLMFSLLLLYLVVLSFLLLQQIGLMSVVLSQFLGQCGEFFFFFFLDFPKCKELYISAFFLSEWKSIRYSAMAW